MKTIELRIRTYGDPALRKKSLGVKIITDSHRKILSGMAQLMYDSGGIGLAAPQVGINETMLVVDIGSGLYKLINPRVVKRSGSSAIEEGCLSLPGICIKVKRAKKITVEAQDESGKPIVIESDDLLACVIQHEMDHLKGRLIVDYANFIDSLKIKRKLLQLKKRPNNEGMPEPETKSCKLQL